ncbi:acyltransferase [Bifidobacterium callitrichidarum]|uniref:Acyltransferase n=1 Tax=Bifidobacterium callitrichidarum TaxID=2052941 RepID=A0A2U2NA92_9BIFI|nr:acyltransferase [Bifidobacterium callitrichidarum]PWG65919.1 acyltransferase [Bifidobacterium callitrichidarum]
MTETSNPHQQSPQLKPPRNVNYDLLRCVAMCLVIGVHVVNNYMPVKMTLTGSAETVRFTLFVIFMTCNPLFIMVSGRFNLTFDAGTGRTHQKMLPLRSETSASDTNSKASDGSRQPNQSDSAAISDSSVSMDSATASSFASFRPYLRYYYKRFVSLIFPYLFYAGALGFTAYLVMDHRSLASAATGTLYDLFSGYDDSVYWFVFMLAGFVLATPFMAPMLRAIGRAGAWLLIGLAAAVAAAEQICSLFGYPLTFLSSFPWRGLLFYYLLGYVLEFYPPSVRARRATYIIAPFALAWTVATPVLFPGHPAQVNRTLTVAYAVVVAAIFLFFRYDVHVRSDRARKAIIWLAGYSYTIYLVHSPLSKVAIGRFLPTPTNGIQYAVISVAMFAATFLAALLFAIIADNLLLKPLQRFLRKVRI